MSLTSCIKKAGPNLHPEDKSAILAAARQYRANGMPADAAAIKAIEDQQKVVAGLIAQPAQVKPEVIAAPVELLAAPRKGDDHIGRDNTPLAEGGKPFSTQLTASTARKLQPDTRVVRVDGGYALAPKTEKQIAAQAKAGRRLSAPNTSPSGEAIPAHAFIAAEGGLNADTYADMNVGSNPVIGNRRLFAGGGRGLTMEQATERLIEDGYLEDGSGQNEAMALIKRSLTNPQYTPEGVDLMAEKEEQARFDAYEQEQEAIAVQQELEDNQFADAANAYEAAMLDYPADVKQSDMSQEDAFLAMGFTEQEYQNAITDESRGPKSSSQSGIGSAEVATGEGAQSDRGRKSTPGSLQGQDDGLTAPTQAEVLAQQERAAQGEKAAKAKRLADAELARRERERKDIARASESASDSFVLGGDAEQNLSGQGGMFDAPAATSANTIFTKDAADAARARLKAKLGRLNSGIDPETLMDGITLAGYHIENGARTFAAYARAMINDLGDGVKPYLKSWYAGVAYDPRAAAFAGMDTMAVMESVDLDKLTTEDNNESNATRNLDSSSAGTLGGTPAPELRAPQIRGDAEQIPDRSGAGDIGGDTRAGAAGGDLPGSLGAVPGAVPVPAAGARPRAKDAKKPRVSGAKGVEPGLGLFGGAGPGGGLTPESGANPAPNAPPIAVPQPSAKDFTITDELALGEGGQKTKYRNNVAAIRLVNDLEATGRLATQEEQAVLAKYVGWGGIAQAFDPENADWKREHAELTALMSPEDFASARRSTRYAHFTSREIVVDGIYAAMRQFGFKGGKTLEAGAGVGNFLGLMPDDMRSAGRFTAIEREPFSSAIARQLYPQQNVQRADFTEFKGNDAYFDAAVGNPPFASDPQTDRSGRKHLSGLSLHNYFFAKSIDMLREGGIMAQVVTNAFMDASGDKARKYMSDRVKLLGAIRLPNNAFSKNANTQVTTDIIFLQKRPDSEIGSKAAREDAKRWLNTGVYRDKQGKNVALNQYFIDNPSMMLGEFGAFGTMYGPDQPALVSRPGQDTVALLKEAVTKLPSSVYQSIAETGTAAQVNAAVTALKNPPVREGGYFVEDGKLMQRLPDIAAEARGVAITAQTQWTEKTTLGDAGVERITALASMRATVRGLLAAEMADDDKGMTALRKTLNEQYDSYRDTHSLINDTSTLRVFEEDPDFPLLASLEHGYVPGIGPAAAKRLGVKPTKSAAKKGPIFSQRVVAARNQVQKVENPVDALAVSMAERGKLDAAYIGELLQMEPEVVLKELSSGDKPSLFRDPVTNEYVLRDAYLSGNVRAKLVQAQAAGLFMNITALQAVQPADVGAHEITARLGSPWVPVQVYENFAESMFGEQSSASVQYIGNNSSYQMSLQGANSVALNNTWGTPAYSGSDLLVAIMNNRNIKVTYVDGDKKTRTDVEATEMANTKAQEIKEKFNDWIFADADRSELLTKAYNETNNNYVTRVYDGSNMTFPGKVPDSVIKHRRHQRNAIARIVQDRTGLLDHVVGAGKTFTVIGGAMELRRTGLARKPMVAVPNHLVKQWAADFYRLYPGANVLTATKKDFEKTNRRKFLARIATGDWDAVVIAHSSFGFIKPAPEFEAQFNNREIAKIMATINDVKSGDSDEKVKKRTVKQLEGMQERLENRIAQLRDKPMDDLLDFEQIGVDQLFVDEAHLFKNLMYSTKMQGVAGLNDPIGSQRAYDMYVKTNQVMEKNGRGQGVVFATGTPVSNSLAEMYHMMRYLMPTQMRELGFESFDAWANTYASVDQVWMQAPSGDGFKAQNRMSNFVNTPELLKMFDQVSDTVTMDDIKTAYKEENDGKEFPLPKVKGGRRTPVSMAKSEAQIKYMEEIAGRAKAIEQRKGPPKKGDDNILVVMSDARKAAMDIRLVDPNITSREIGGRIDRATDEAVARYQQYNSVKGAQLVFSDLGTPLKHAKAELKEYEALQLRVMAANDDLMVSANLGNEAAMEIVQDAEEAQAELDTKGLDWLSAVKSALRGFSVYDDFKAALIEKGIPEAEIAFIHDFNTDDQKAALFRKVNAGQIRFLLGSTAKLGAGTNVQERLVALHHLDVPWRPSDVEQREGRIERQGNALMNEVPNFEVEILAYVTRDTLDMRMWQVQETKLKMINQLRTRKIGREIDNAFEDMELSAGEMQAAATGDINLLKEIQLRNDVKKLEQRKRSFDAQSNDLISRKRRNADLLNTLPAKVAQLAVEAKFAEDYAADLKKNPKPFAMNIDGKDFTEAAEAQAVLRELNDAEESVTDLAGEVTQKKKPLKVVINGEVIKNRAVMNEMYSEARGDIFPIKWDFNDQTFNRRSKLQTAIRQQVVDAVADEQINQIGKIGVYAASVEGQPDKKDSEKNAVELTLSRDGNVIHSQVFSAYAGTESLPGRITDSAENMLEGSVQQLDYAKSQLKAAQSSAAELASAPASGAWPDQGKLDTAREAHKAILGKLKEKNSTPTPDNSRENIAQTGAAAGNTSDVVFSRTQSPTDLQRATGKQATVQAYVNSITAKWANAPDVVVVRDMQDTALPERIRKADEAAVANGATGTPEGVFYQGRVYLMADQINSLDHAFTVLAHEALGHFGLRGMFGNSLDDIKNQIATLRSKEVLAKGLEYGLAMTPTLARKALGAGATSADIARMVQKAKLYAAEEVLAEMAQKTPNIGFVRRAVAAIRTWLRQNVANFNSLALTDDEIIRLFIIPARGFVVRGEQQQAPGGALAFSRSADDKTTTNAPMFSRTLADTVSTALNSAKDVRLPAGYVVNDFFNGDGKVGWWHKSVGTPYNLAQRSPQFKRVYDGVQNFINDVSQYATEAADMAPNILPKLDTWKDITKSPLTAIDNKAIARPIFEGTLNYGRTESGKLVQMAELEEAAFDMTPLDKSQQMLRKDVITEGVLKMWRGLPVEQHDRLVNSRYAAQMLQPGAVFTAEELRSEFSLTDGQIKLYEEFRGAIDKSVTLLALSDMVRYGGEDLTSIRDTIMQAATVEEGSALARDYLMSLTEGSTRPEQLLDMAGTLIDKSDKARALMDRGYAPLSRFGQHSLDVVDSNGERAYFGLFESKSEAAKMARRMAIEFPGAAITQGTTSEEAYKLFAGVSPETLELFGEMLGLEAQGDSASAKAFQDYLKLAKSSRSAMKRLIRRKGIAGFSQDPGRVLAGFIYSNSRQIAGGLNMREVDQSVNAIPQGMGQMKDQASKLRDYVKNPQQEGQAIRGLLFTQYLGGSIASAMVNMTQPFTMTMPYLAQFGGVANSAKVMTAAVADVMKKTTGDTKLDAALKLAEEKGIVAPQEVHQLMAQANGAGSLRPGDGTTYGDASAKAFNGLSRLSLVWGKLFSAAEQFNRRVTFIAAYRVAVAQNMPNPSAFATKAIDETQGVYNKGNKPVWARGAVGGILFTFKQYSVAYLELAHRMATQGGPEGKKAALLMAAVLMLVGGMGGLPFVEDVEDIVDGIMQRLGYNFSAKQKRDEFLTELLGKEGAKFLQSGLSGLPGVPIDFSGRMGMKNLWPGTGLFLKKNDYTNDVLEFAGPAADLIKRGFQAANALAGGNVGTAVNKLLPTAASNMVKAVDMYNSGIYKDQRGRKVIDVDAYDAMFKGIGFQPNDVAQVQEATRTVQNLIGQNKLRETEIADKWALAMFNKDPEGVAEARDMLKDWNEKNPMALISIQMPQIIKRVRAMNESKQERIAKTSPKEIRATVRRELAGL